MSHASTPPGWDAAWEQARRAADPDGRLTEVRVSAAHRGAYHAVRGADTATIEARGRHYRAATDRRALPVVGDYCLVSGWQDALAGKGSAVLEVLLPRRSLLVRRAAGAAVAPQPMAANVDLALIVTSANSDLAAQRIDRYVELVRDGGIAPLVVVSKLDLADDAEVLLAEVRRLVPGVDVAGTSLPTGRGVHELQARVAPGQTAILLGSSGVGKSSLLSALAGWEQRTAPIRARDERGQHTTTVRQLFVSASGALWIDTPGMRELAAFSEGELWEVFPDIAALAARCRFADCRHQREPGCAVNEAVRGGALTGARLASYHKLSAERAADRERTAMAGRMAQTRTARRNVSRRRPT